MELVTREQRYRLELIRKIQKKAEEITAIKKPIWIVPEHYRWVTKEER